MKPLKHILLLFLLIGCSKEDIVDLKTRYPYDPSGSNIINVDVIPVGDVIIEFDDMSLEVNADYFNRYGITVDLRLKDRIPVPQYLIDDPERLFIPKDNERRIKVYVIDEEYVRVMYNEELRASAYAVKRAVVLGEGQQTTRTLAHELGHVHGLDHVELPNNVMNINVHALQYDKPNDFTEEQVGTILENIY